MIIGLSGLGRFVQLTSSGIPCAFPMSCHTSVGQDRQILTCLRWGDRKLSDVGHLNRLGALKEKLDKCVSAWYNLIQDEISVVEEKE